MHALRKIIILLLAGLFARSAQAQHYTATRSDGWEAVDALGRRIVPEQYPSRRENKTVAIFYFLWMGAHGYDRHTGDAPEEGIFIPSKQDSCSPYDISALLRDNPEHPAYGPVHAFHHWGEPYLGYYVSNDEWVIEKHVQMLADAGVDVMVCDNTNARIYLPQILTLCRVMTRMRQQGRTTPRLSFIINSDPQGTLSKLYEGFFKKGLYRDLWFNWEGKPLVLCPSDHLSPELKQFFTLRHSWFSSGEAWFGDGKDKWPWADFYPQKYGWHESPDRPEAISVAATTHPIAHIGRSYHDGSEPAYNDSTTAAGAFFAEQWKQALKVDPSFIFVTGWNEWVAMRMTDGLSANMLNRKIKPGDTYFVDQYNEEFSRDIEPMRGGFGDSYYYQLADYIRRYKGVAPEPPEQKRNNIRIDGRFDDWTPVEASYHDDRGDITPRNHFGFGRVGQLTDRSGRNDIVSCKAATDGKNIYFYAETAAPLTPHSDSGWMQLYIGSGNPQHEPEWEGFRFRINDRIKNNRQTLLQQYAGNRQWKEKQTVRYQASGNRIELSVPLSTIGIKPGGTFTVTFKWTDNVPMDDDIQNCMNHGDSAPNGRFRYRFTFNNP